MGENRWPRPQAVEARAPAEGSKTEWPEPTEEDKQESVSEALDEAATSGPSPDHRWIGDLVECLEKRGWSYEPELSEWDLLTAVDKVLEWWAEGRLFALAEAMSELKQARGGTR